MSASRTLPGRAVVYEGGRIITIVDRWGAVLAELEPDREPEADGEPNDEEAD